MARLASDALLGLDDRQARHEHATHAVVSRSGRAFAFEALVDMPGKHGALQLLAALRVVMSGVAFRPRGGRDFAPPALGVGARPVRGIAAASKLGAQNLGALRAFFRLFCKTAQDHPLEFGRDGPMPRRRRGLSMQVMRAELDDRLAEE